MAAGSTGRALLWPNEQPLGARGDPVGTDGEALDSALLPFFSFWKRMGAYDVGDGRGKEDSGEAFPRPPESADVAREPERCEDDDRGCGHEGCAETGK